MTLLFKASDITGAFQSCNVSSFRQVKDFAETAPCIGVMLSNVNDSSKHKSHGSRLSPSFMIKILSRKNFFLVNDSKLLNEFKQNFKLKMCYNYMEE
jgi:hypothetical protein